MDVSNRVPMASRRNQWGSDEGRWIVPSFDRRRPRGKCTTHADRPPVVLVGWFRRRNCLCYCYYYHYYRLSCYCRAGAAASSKTRMARWWCAGSPVHHPNQVLSLDLGSCSAPPYSTGYPTTIRRSNDTYTQQNRSIVEWTKLGSAKMRGLPVGEPSSSHWRPLVKEAYPPTIASRQTMGKERRHASTTPQNASSASL